MGGGIMESGPLQIGGIAHFCTRSMGGITEYRGQILPNMLDPPPPPVVNDMSLMKEMSNEQSSWVTKSVINDYPSPVTTTTYDL